MWGGVGGYGYGCVWTHVWDPIPFPCAGSLTTGGGSPHPNPGARRQGGGVLGRLLLQPKNFQGSPTMGDGMQGLRPKSGNQLITSSKGGVQLDRRGDSVCLAPTMFRECPNRR